MSVMLRSRPTFSETVDPLDAPRVSALAVVRIAHSADVRVFDWALSLRGEHGAAVHVIGVWMPAWWHCVACTNPSGLMPGCGDERQRAEQWWSERCREAGADVRFAGLCSAWVAILAELGCARHEYLVVGRSAVSSRMARHLRRRHSGIRLMRV